MMGNESMRSAPLSLAPHTDEHLKIDCSLLLYLNFVVVCALTLVVDESQNNRRRKRAAVNATSPSFDPHEANFSMAIVTSGCRTYDETTNQWTDNGCQVTYTLFYYFE